MQRGYVRSVLWSLAHERIVFAIFLASIAGSYALYRVMPQDFIPSDDYGQLHGSVQLPGTSFDRYIRYTREVVQIIERDPNVSGVQSDQAAK
jgi:multidrug efflux pump